MSGKGRTEKTQKQDSAWSEHGGKKNELFDLVGKGDVVYCHVRCAWEGEMWCTVTCGARDYDQSRPNPTLFT